MSEATPGPWIATPEVAWAGGTWNIDTEDGKGVASSWPGELGPEAAEANAALIADAPRLSRMAEAGEELKDSIDGLCSVVGDRPCRSRAEEQAWSQVFNARKKLVKLSEEARHEAQA